MQSASCVARTDLNVRVLSAVAIRAAMNDLASMFEADTKCGVGLVFDTNPAIARRIEASEPFDVAIINPHLIDGLIGAGLVDPASRVRFGTSPMGVAIPATSAPIDVSTIRAFEHVVLAVKSIGYSADGTSGLRLHEILGHLGILDDVRAKLRPLAGGRAGTAVAAGEVEISIAPVSTLIAAGPATVVAGILPGGAESQIEFDVAIATSPRNRRVADEFVEFLKSPRIDALISAKGIERFPRFQPSD